jgi:hypothetical protein
MMMPVFTVSFVELGHQIESAMGHHLGLVAQWICGNDLGIAQVADAHLDFLL